MPDRAEPELRETLLGLTDDEFDRRWNGAPEERWSLFSAVSVERDRRRRMRDPDLAALAARLSTLTTADELDRHLEADGGIRMSKDRFGTYCDEYYRRGWSLPP